MDDDVVGWGGGGVADFEAEAAWWVDDAVLSVVAEGDGLAVFESDEVVVAGVGLFELFEGAVVEDVAVLVDLDEGGALVSAAALEDLSRCLRSMSMVRATKVASAPMARESGLKGWSASPAGWIWYSCRFAGGRVLAFGEAVDAVVEEEDFEVDVAAEDVDEVVAADGEGVAVAGDDPDCRSGRAT